MRGRKPKPTALKLIDGNPGKRPINAHEPTATGGGKPTCPSHLSPTAKSEWKRISGTLHELGIADHRRPRRARRVLPELCPVGGRGEEARRDAAAHQDPVGLREAVAMAQRGQQIDGADGPLHGGARHHTRLAQPRRFG